MFFVTFPNGTVFNFFITNQRINLSLQSKDSLEIRKFNKLKQIKLVRFPDSLDNKMCWRTRLKSKFIPKLFPLGNLQALLEHLQQCGGHVQP